MNQIAIEEGLDFPKQTVGVAKPVIVLHNLAI
jgi:hypothetical protein